MKKFFTIGSALLLAVASYAQFTKHSVSNPYPLRSYSMIPQLQTRGEAQASQVWWGYVGQDEEVYGVGTGSAETFDCASFYDGNSIAGGKTIKSVRFHLLSSNISNVKVWLAESLPTDVSSAMQVVNVANPVTGINEIDLTTPYTVGSNGIYVGYTFTVTKANNDDDKYPVACAGEDVETGLYLRSSSSVPEWTNLYGYGFGSLFLQVLLEGSFPTASASFATSNIGEVVALPSSEATITTPIINQGSDPISSISYVLSDGEGVSPEYTAQLSSPISFGAKGAVNIKVATSAVASVEALSATITKVNGVANEYANATTQFTLTTVSRQTQRGVAVEEFTGTGCGWCPRGFVGMENMRNKYGDQFIGIAIHRYNSSDAMYNTTYTHVSFSGAPSCRLNRGEELDPYYGTYYSVFDDFDAELAVPAKVAVSVSGEWNADSTKVIANAMLENLVPSADYKIEYVLIADGLTGTGSSWNQANYYYQYSARDLPSDLAMFGSGGKYGTSSVKGLVFNDVALSVAKSSQTTAPGTMTLGQTVSNTYTLSMPTKTTLKNAIKDKSQVAVIALVIDANTGRIANADKFYMPSSGSVVGISEVPASSASASDAQTFYTIDGKQLQQPKRGLNIVRMADGTVRKVNK